MASVCDGTQRFLGEGREAPHTACLSLHTSALPIPGSLQAYRVVKDSVQLTFWAGLRAGTAGLWEVGDHLTAHPFILPTLLYGFTHVLFSSLRLSAIFPVTLLHACLSAPGSVSFLLSGLPLPLRLSLSHFLSPVLVSACLFSPSVLTLLSVPLPSPFRSLPFSLSPALPLPTPHSTFPF